MRQNFRQFLPLGLAITLISGLIFAVAQQNYRLGVNDVPVQISQDVAGVLESGRDPKQVIPAAPIDIAKSLAVFAIAYDDSGNVIVSSAQLDGKAPELPKGVLDYARAHGQSRISWQPRQGVRSAIIVTRFNGEKPGFILVGRSLAEAEKMISMLSKEVGLGWIVTLTATFIATVVFSDKKKRK